MGMLSQNGERKEVEEVKVWNPRTAFLKQLWAKTWEPENLSRLRSLPKRRLVLLSQNNKSTIAGVYDGWYAMRVLRRRAPIVLFSGASE
jgi:hypothetical protein